MRGNMTKALPGSIGLYWGQKHLASTSDHSQTLSVLGSVLGWGFGCVIVADFLVFHPSIVQGLQTAWGSVETGRRAVLKGLLRHAQQMLDVTRVQRKNVSVLKHLRSGWPCHHSFSISRISFPLGVQHRVLQWQGLTGNMEGGSEVEAIVLGTQGEQLLRPLQEFLLWGAVLDAEALSFPSRYDFSICPSVSSLSHEWLCLRQSGLQAITPGLLPHSWKPVSDSKLLFP